jgi:hypothetical protein
MPDVPLVKSVKGAVARHGLCSFTGTAEFGRWWDRLAADHDSVADVDGIPRWARISGSHACYFRRRRAGDGERSKANSAVVLSAFLVCIGGRRNSVAVATF